MSGIKIADLHKAQQANKEYMELAKPLHKMLVDLEMVQLSPIILYEDGRLERIYSNDYKETKNQIERHLKALESLVVRKYSESSSHS